MSGENRLYRNRGDWRFEDITARANVSCRGQFSTGAILADFDGDGDLDLLVSSIGNGTRLFRNDGKGNFVEAPDAGLDRSGGSTSMALADVDGDGFLDLYVANYHTRTMKDSLDSFDVRAGYVDGKFVVTRPDLFSPIYNKSGGVSLFERGQPDAFYLNDGRGRFKRVPWTNSPAFSDGAGKPLVEEPRDWGLSVAFRDLNADGFPDLYICNDFFGSPDRIWINDGKGHFHPIPAFAVRQQSMSSMAVDFADVNRDGNLDFLVVDMMSRKHELRQRQRGSLSHVQAKTPWRDPLYRPEYPRNTFFLGAGNGIFTEIAQFAGLDASEWSWSASFIDVDLDGFEDVLITTGNLRDANDGDIAGQRATRMAPANTPRSRPRFPKLESAKLAFRNRGDLTFEETGRAWGFDQIGIAHGLAMADLDNDGDMDLVVNEMDRPVGLYRNDSDAPRITVRLKGRVPNTAGIGAKVVVRDGAVPLQSQEVMSGGRYLSCDDPVRMFAAGTPTNRLHVEVSWRSGVKTAVEIAANNAVEIFEPANGSPPSNSTKQSPPTAFEDRSSSLKRLHRDADFNDFERQPLLPRRLSHLGPGVTWYDLDGDGWDDLLVPAGANDQQTLYLNDGKGGFRGMRRSGTPRRDQTTLLVVRAATNQMRLVTGQSNYKDGGTNDTAITSFDPHTNTEIPLVPADTSVVGPLALGTIDHELALFVGGRSRTGAYPERPDSALYLGDGHAWRKDTNSQPTLAHLGMVSGATWMDWDGDGRPELVVATDWGPIRILSHRTGRWTELTQSLGLEAFTGLWNGVAAGDFDGDGRLDLIAANWGLNSKYRRHAGNPIRLYYGNWLGGDRMDMLEAYYDPALKKYVPFLPLDQLRQFLPPLAEGFPTFAAYSTAGIEDILRPHPGSTNYLEARWFASTLFLNRGDHVEARALPAEAQFAPGFGVSVGDLDGDGNEDAFLSQNFFGTDAEMSRMDAGRGLWLRGDGKGNFTPVPSAQSGILLHGEQRGSALCDYDHDGRTDLVVAQNNGALGLFRNSLAAPGLRLRLRGPQWNPDAVGATVRLRRGATLGPARQITVGSGYWSQDSSVQVLSVPTGATAVQVRWPGGKVTEHPLAAGAREVEISSP